MKPLYPPIKPYAQHNLQVQSPHVLYVEESGNPKGIPVLFVHGGPGAGCSSEDRRFFDPDEYRIILFDQRGCGQSTPFACLEKNNVDALLQDMEAIRAHLNVKSWVLFGGSWGATLSLLYAQQFPKQVLGLILRGVFLSRKEDLHWFYQEGASKIFPDHWEEFVSLIPDEERSNLIQAYYKRLAGEDEVTRMNAAKRWAQWEGQCATLYPCKTICDHLANPHNALGLALIETHYFMHQSFLEPNQILQNANKLTGIKGIMVQGRYDVICPLEGAMALQKAWPQSELHIVRDAGHSAFEPGIIDLLVNATQKMAHQLR